MKAGEGPWGLKYGGYLTEEVIWIFLGPDSEMGDGNCFRDLVPAGGIRPGVAAAAPKAGGSNVPVSI